MWYVQYMMRHKFALWERVIYHQSFHQKCQTVLAKPVLAIATCIYTTMWDTSLKSQLCSNKKGNPILVSHHAGRLFFSATSALTFHRVDHFSYTSNLVHCYVEKMMKIVISVHILAHNTYDTSLNYCALQSSPYVKLKYGKKIKQTLSCGMSIQLNMC